MAEAIESVINPWMVEQFTSNMGSGSSYTNSKLASVKISVLSIPIDWKDWALPALAISHRFGEFDYQAHPFTLGNTIVYRLTFVTHGTQDQAIAEGEKLLYRGFKTLIAIKDSLNELSNDDGQRVNEMIFYKSGRAPVGTGAYQMRRFIDQDVKGKYFIAHDLNMAFLATTGV